MTSRVVIRRELALGGQLLEWSMGKTAIVIEVVEYFPIEDEKSSIDQFLASFRLFTELGDPPLSDIHHTKPLDRVHGAQGR